MTPDNGSEPGRLTSQVELSEIRVLLVEDNPGDARLFEELLRESRVPFALKLETTMKGALERLEKESFHVVILDLTLPDSRGIETFYSVRRRFGGVPIIVLSGLNDEELALRTVEEGAQDYLVKGHVDCHSLVRAIRYAIKRAEAERELKAERSLLRSVIDNIPDSIYVKDAEGHYLLGNIALAKACGVGSPEELVGKRADEFASESVKERIRNEDAVVLGSGESIINSEVFIVDGRRGPEWISSTKVPLQGLDGDVVGVVGIDKNITGRKDAEEQLYRYNAEIRQRNAELEEDLHMAREIQQSFLPQQYPTFPRRVPAAESALNFYSRYIPTTAVGGDFFHILPISDVEAGVFICDVMGHGVRAALVTAIQRALVEEMLPVAHNPGLFLTEINRALRSILRRARTPMFASAFYLVVNVKEGVIRYANAGHPKPLHLRRDEGRLGFLVTGAPGPALGIFRNSVYETRTASISLHDLIILFTDGLFEVEGEGNVLFDQEKLLQTVTRHQEEPTEELISGTLADVQDFALNHAFSDDVCLVGVEIDRLFNE